MELVDKIINKLKEKKNPENVPEENISSGNADNLAEKILQKLDEKFPPLPVLRFEPERAENLSAFETKLGGVPYFPKDMEYPTDRAENHKGEPLRLLAQLNFEKLPHIENFPQKGILQFFCACNDECVYGLDFDDPCSAKSFRVIYHENIVADESRLLSAEDMPKFSGEYGEFPFEGEFILKAGKPEMCPLTFTNYVFEDTVSEIYSEVTGNEVKNWYNIDDNILDKINEARNYEDTCIGGYPFFTQSDPRYKNEIKDCNILLFQCTSFTSDDGQDEVMWSDLGVANFFIPEENLKKLDFSKVVYNWDCG